MALSDYIPDFSDPNTMAALGALGGVLTQGSAIRPGTGIGAGNAIASLLGAGLQGGISGAQAANQYAGQQLKLQQEKALAPAQTQARLAMLNGMSGNAYTPQQLNSSSFGNIGGAMNPYAQQMINAAQAAYGLEGKSEPLANAYKSIFENDPSVVAAKKLSEVSNSFHDTPDGPVFGLGGVQMPTQYQSAASIPVQSQAIQGITDKLDQNTIANALPASSLGSNQQSIVQQLPSQVAANPLPANGVLSAPPAYNPNSKASVAGATKSAEENAANLADAEKTYNVMLSNIPNVMQRANDMLSINDKASFGPFVNDEHGKGIGTDIQNLFKTPASVANATLAQRANQGILPELGPQLAQAGAKPNKSLEQWANAANNIDLTMSDPARKEAINGIVKGYLQNLISTHNQIKQYGGQIQPLPRETIVQAVVNNVLTKDQAIKYLQENHGMK